MEEAADPVETVRVLLDPSRLAVAGALAVAPATAEQVAERVGGSTRDALQSIAALRSAGLVTAADNEYSLDVDALRQAARRLSTTALPMDPQIGYGMTDDERVVLSRFFEGRVLTEIPTNRSKRLVVLERLALEFEVGRHYHELEVNEILGAFHPDWSSLRRYLVDEGLLDRADNQYWRSGGKVLLDA